MLNKVMLSTESRMRGDMQVRFGGRYGKTYCRKAVRRSVPSLRLARSGDIIDLGILIYHTNDISRVLKLIENATPGVPVKARTFLPSSEERNEILRNIQIGALTSVALKSYLASRGIDMEIGIRECREVRYLTGGKPYFAVGFPNRSGGYEIRNKLFKGCIAPKDITHIRQEQPKETCYLFEGFMDYLSFLTLRLERCPDRPDLDGQDYIVLNSTSNLSKAIRPLGGYERIHCFLDNDKAGMEAVQELREEYGLRIRDASHIYGGYNDLNDFLRGKQNRQSERRREKPEPEKSQQKAEQPKKKNKGIRM